MIKVIRYALAIVCVAASVGHLALWLRGVDFEWCLRVSKHKEFIYTVFDGMWNVEIYTAGAFTPMSCRFVGPSLLGSALIFAVAGIVALPRNRKTAHL